MCAFMQFRGAACTVSGALLLELENQNLSFADVAVLRISKMHGANSNVLPTVSYSDQCTKLAATGKVLLASYFSIFPSMQHSEAVGDGSHHAHYLYRITSDLMAYLL
ncbi:hypothetical protein M514_08770 [Trichuris suis]|uniref:Uncharacterized protein n=1 Tax=Trichuris suis TaxID=68888 RepID=A0A085N7G6_9BILA|nr:hypothetical protein M513_08770 [Trichuris suis]KFD65412.1 hypothetical protein M514_08770 [Trichuris suis]